MAVASGVQRVEIDFVELCEDRRIVKRARRRVAGAHKAIALAFWPDSRLAAGTLRPRFRCTGNRGGDMPNIDELFATFPDAEMIPVMKRAFDQASARIQSQGLHGDAPSADAVAAKILKLAREGVKSVDALTEMAVGHEYDSG
jgi:hypothetical protein